MLAASLRAGRRAGLSICRPVSVIATPASWGSTGAGHRDRCFSAAAAPAAPAAPTQSEASPAEEKSTTGLFGQKFEVPKIRAIKRSTVGSRNAQWARMHQLIPGIVYGFDAEGRDTVELVYVKESDLRKEVNKRGRSFTNTLFDIELDGKVQRVLPRDFQIHPFKPKAISINWLRYRVGAYPGVRLDIPLKAFNQERCPAFKEGGWLLELQRKLPVYASGEEIPDYLMMDLRGKKVGEKIMASSIELSEGLTLRTKVADFAVAKFIGSRKGGATEEADAAAGKDGKKAAKAAPAAAGDAKK